MTDAGDIWLADLNDERRRRVLVLSSARFHRLAGRALVAPELPGPPDDRPFPWRIEVEGTVYAVDLLRSLPTERLLERVDRLPAPAVAAARRALHHVT